MNNKTLVENLRCIPDFPQKGINFRDVTTLFKKPEVHGDNARRNV